MRLSPYLAHIIYIDLELAPWAYLEYDLIGSNLI